MAAGTCTFFLRSERSKLLCSSQLTVRLQNRYKLQSLTQKWSKLPVHLTENNFLRIVKIEEVIEESPLVKTIFFQDKLCSKSKPGQFIMVWLPGFDEIPMSISSAGPNESTSITVANVGEATMLLHKKEKGSIMGVRGPFGRSFSPVKGNLLLVAGGTGIAPIAFLVEKLVRMKARITLLLGGRVKEELLFLPKIRRVLSKSEAFVGISTDDGSFGHKGAVTELVEDELTAHKFDMIYACGNEAMLFKVFKLAEKHRTPLEASLERLMRCAIGLCGSCTVGKYRVCVDGPVFTDKQLQEVREEFGCFKRGFDGQLKPL